MKLAVIGAGKVGSLIVKRVLDSNIEVVIGSRHAAGDINGVKTLPIEEAIKIADTIVIAIPGTATSSFLTEYRDALQSKIIIDASNEVEVTSTWEYHLHHLKDAKGLRYARAFSMLGYEAMSAQHIDGQTVDMFYVANETEKGTVKTLINAVGLRPIYVGDLTNIHLIDNLLYLWGTLAQQYGTRDFAFKVLGI